MQVREAREERPRVASRRMREREDSRASGPHRWRSLCVAEGVEEGVEEEVTSTLLYVLLVSPSNSPSAEVEKRRADLPFLPSLPPSSHPLSTRNRRHHTRPDPPRCVDPAVEHRPMEAPADREEDKELVLRGRGEEERDTTFVLLPLLLSLVETKTLTSNRRLNSLTLAESNSLGPTNSLSRLARLSTSPSLSLRLSEPRC